MRIFRLPSPLSRLAAGVAVVGSSAILLAGVLVTPAGAASGPPFTSKVAVTSNASNLQTGQPATFTAKVSANPHGTPGGQATFTITGADTSVVHCDAGDAVALASGTATCTVASGLSATSGPFVVRADYLDTVDTNFKPATGSRSQSVVAGGSTTTLSSSTNPSVTGQGISFNAVVAAESPAVGTPGGTVTFTGVTCDGGTNAIALVSGQAQCQLSHGLVGQNPAYVVTGAYAGDGRFSASSGALHQTVMPAATTVTLTPSTGSCIGDVCTLGQGQAISFVAHAAASGLDGGAGTPTGTMTFTIARPGSNASLSCDGGSNAIALNPSGTATCTVTAGLPAIVYYKVTAVLSSPGFVSSTGTLFENSALTGTNTVVSAPRNLGAGQSFDVTAVVTPTPGYTGSNVPAGFVNILVCGSNSNGGNGCQGGAAPVDSSGSAVFTVGGGEFPGVYSYQAVYTGDTNFYSSTAHARLLNVSQSPTALALSESGGFFSVDGAAVAITATVSVPNGAAGSTLVGPPTGNVTFSITGPGGPVTCTGGNGIALSSGPGQVEGSVSCFLPPGTLTNSTPPTTSYAVTVNYAGDSNYHMSNSHATQVVTAVAV